jgi:hypothetical protein
LKNSDEKKILNRFKIVRNNFIQGELWDKNSIKFNKLK